MFISFYSRLGCDTMWVERQADDFFVCFGAKPNKGLSSRSLTRPEVGRKGKPVRSKGTQRGSFGVGRCRGAVDNGAEETSRREIESRGSEEDGQR